MRIALVGNLAGTGYSALRILRARGVDAHLFISCSEVGATWEEIGQYQPLEGIEWLHVYDCFDPPSANPLVLVYRWIRRSLKYVRGVVQLMRRDVIHSFTGSLFSNSLWYLAFGIFHMKPYIACATGSDIREQAREHDRSGKRMLAFFRKARKSLLLNLDMVDVRDQLGLKNTMFFPFAIDTDKFCPGLARRDHCPEGHILFLMPSHLDWGVVDNKERRNSTKGNDRFLRAFARFVREYGNAHAIVLDRGPDRNVAKHLVKDLGISSSVTFLPAMKKNDLIKYYRMADVVVDQFDVGAFGFTGLEAMSCAKPVLIYLKNNCVNQCYPEVPPVFNARTEDDIYECIKQLTDKSVREDTGRKARQWILKYHQEDLTAAKLMDIYTEVMSRT